MGQSAGLSFEIPSRAYGLTRMYQEKKYGKTWNRKNRQFSEIPVQNNTHINCEYLLKLSISIWIFCRLHALQTGEQNEFS